MEVLNKFKVVDEVPELQKGEHLIQYPNFVQEIRDSRLKVSNEDKVKLTQNNMLRNAFVLIGMRYDKPAGNQDPFNAFAIPLGRYEGIPYKTEQDVSDLLVKILLQHAPKLIDDAIVTQINERPADTELVYFYGPEEKAHLFVANGFVKE